MKKKIVLGVTIGGSSKLLEGQAHYFKELGYDVYLMSQNHYKEKNFCEKEGIAHLPISITNEINPIKDLISLFQIFLHLRKIKPDIVNFGTAKISLLGLMCAYFLKVPKRIYGCWGLRFETETGLKRRILIFSDKLIVKFATKVIYISNSSFEVCLKNGLVSPKKTIFINKGTSNGIDTNKFNINNVDLKKSEDLKLKYQLKDKVVIGYAGRITRDKGSYELVEAFENLFVENNNVRLVLMGHIYCDDIFKERFLSNSNIVYIPFQDDVPLYMSLFDIFVLPSWREGFPNVPIQAAAMGIPVVVSNATGCVDSVEDGVNGTIFQVKDSHALYKVLKKYIDHPELRIEHGAKGLDWAKQFDQKKIWNGIQKVYES